MNKINAIIFQAGMTPQELRDAIKKGKKTVKELRK
jgi:hypothetical protein